MDIKGVVKEIGELVDRAKKLYLELPKDDYVFYDGMFVRILIDGANVVIKYYDYEGNFEGREVYSCLDYRVEELVEKIKEAINEDIKKMEVIFEFRTFIDEVYNNL